MDHRICLTVEVEQPRRSSLTRRGLCNQLRRKVEVKVANIHPPPILLVTSIVPSGATSTLARIMTPPTHPAQLTHPT
jgi:hypothetical protein